MLHLISYLQTKVSIRYKFDKYCMLTKESISKEIDFICNYLQTQVPRGAGAPRGRKSLLSPIKKAELEKPQRSFTWRTILPSAKIECLWSISTPRVTLP